MGQNQVKEVKVEEEDGSSTPILLSNMSDKEKEKEEIDIHKLAYIGDLDKIKDLLAKDDFLGESLTRKLDSVGMTPVHNAALGGGKSNLEIVKTLLKHDQDDIRSSQLDPLVDLKDSRGKTALHYAAASKRPELIGELISEFKADPNILDQGGFTPLHICVSQGHPELEAEKDDAVKCADRMLHSKVLNRYAPCGPQRDSRTPVHLAVAAMSHGMLKFLLNNGFDHSKQDSRGLTPLHLAASAGDTSGAVRCVKELLRIASSAKDVNARASETGQTPLHMAAFKCHFKVLEALLQDPNVDIWAHDNQKRTALHWATEAWFRSQSLSCVKLLVESDKIVDWHEKVRFLHGENSNESGDDSKKKAKDESAMDIALKHKSIRIAEYLIQAHPSPEAWLDDEMLEKIYKTLPEAMIPLMNCKGLSYNPAKFHERNESVSAEFGVLTGFKDPVEDEAKQETKYLNNILYAPKEIQQSLFLHPLVQIFIDLKWKKIKSLTWASIIFQALWLLLYTCLIFEIYVPNCPPDEPTMETIDEAHSKDKDGVKKSKSLKLWQSLGFYSKDESTILDCEFDISAARIFTAILYILTAMIVTKEMFQILKKKVHYFKDPTNLFQWILIVLFIFNSAPVFQNDPQIAKWQSYLAAFGIFIAWVLILREVGKVPSFGIYAAILKKVFWHCLKMLLFYVPLLFAFGFCLRLLLPGKGQYNYLFFAIVKVVIMMTGELDFEDALYEEDGPKLALHFIFSQFVFLLLVFITTIVLLNLLTGLAVNDVQSLIEEAEINRLSNELEQIYLLESLLLDIRLKFGLDKFLSFFHGFNVTSVVASEYVYFASKIEGIETKSYSPDLKKRIKASMVPDESDQ